MATQAEIHSPVTPFQSMIIHRSSTFFRCHQQSSPSDRSKSRLSIGRNPQNQRNNHPLIEPRFRRCRSIPWWVSVRKNMTTITAYRISFLDLKGNPANRKRMKSCNWKSVVEAFWSQALPSSDPSKGPEVALGDGPRCCCRYRRWELVQSTMEENRVWGGSRLAHIVLGWCKSSLPFFLKIIDATSIAGMFGCLARPYSELSLRSMWLTAALQSVPKCPCRGKENPSRT